VTIHNRSTRISTADKPTHQEKRQSMTRFALIAALAMLLCGTAGAQPEPWAGGPVVQNARVIVIYWGAPTPRSAVHR
jgi:hypothetical protein